MSMSLLSESVPLAKRNPVVLLVSSIFLLSQGIMAGERMKQRYSRICYVVSIKSYHFYMSYHFYKSNYYFMISVLAIPIIPLSFSYYLPALGIYWNSWRTLLVVYSFPSIITAVWLYFMQESPKFVFIKGDEDRALQILRTIHRINNLRSKEDLEVGKYVLHLITFNIHYILDD